MPVARRSPKPPSCSSWIRQMFEEGARLAEIHGCDAVADFSIGNPNLEPPQEFQQVAQRSWCASPRPGPTATCPTRATRRPRAAVAAYLAKTRASRRGRGHVVMTCGAGGRAERHLQDHPRPR